MSTEPRAATVEPSRIVPVIPDEHMVANYAGFIWINATNHDLTINFAQLVASFKQIGTEVDSVQARVVSRIILTPKTAAELVELLTKQLDAMKPDNDQQTGG